MDKSKLIILLKTLSTSEFKQYGSYLEGASFRKTSGAFLLFNYLKKFHPDYPESKVSKEVVKKKVFKNNVPTNQRLFDLMYILYTSLENFLIQKKLEVDKAERDLLVLDILKDRKLDKLFFLKANQVEKDWSKSHFEGIEHLHNIYKLHNMSFLHPNHSIFSKNVISQETLAKDIDSYYYSAKLYTTLIHKLNQKVIVSKNPIIDKNSKMILEAIVNLSTTENFANIPQIALLGNLLKSLNDQDYSNISNLQNQFKEHLSKYNQYEKHDIIHALIRMNYANHLAGNENAARKMFELNKFAVDNMIIIEDGFIQSEYFKQIVDVACTVGELDWTENFITNYSKYLKSEFKEHNLALCNALVLFEKGHYSDVLSKITQVPFENPVYAVQIKALQLQCYFELEDYDDLFFNLVKSYSTYLKRNNVLPQNFIEPSETFIKFSTKLYLAKHSINHKSDNLVSEISGLQKVIKKRWLLSKAEENKPS